MSRLVNRRIRLFLVALIVGFAGLFLRAAWLQGIRAQSLSRLGLTQHREEVIIPASRGTIFDRTGVRVALGESATTVYADPMPIRQPRRVAKEVAQVLALDPDALYPKLADRSRGFVYLARQADAGKAALLARKRIAGLGFINVVGLKPSAGVSDAVGVVKLLGLFAFVVVGLCFVRAAPFHAAALAVWRA